MTKTTPGAAPYMSFAEMAKLTSPVDRLRELLKRFDHIERDERARTPISKRAKQRSARLLREISEAKQRMVTQHLARSGGLQDEELTPRRWLSAVPNGNDRREGAGPAAPRRKDNG